MTTYLTSFQCKHCVCVPKGHSVRLKSDLGISFHPGTRDVEANFLPIIVISHKDSSIILAKHVNAIKAPGTLKALHTDGAPTQVFSLILAD